MSKCYVIKDGMFYARGTTQWVDELPFASIFNKKEDAEKLKNKIKKECDDCNPQVITLTICEGDLEEENRVLKAKLETAEYWNRKYDSLLEQFHNYKLKMFEYAQKLMSLGKAFEPDVLEFLELTKEDTDKYINAQLDIIQQAKESENDR